MNSQVNISEKFNAFQSFMHNILQIISNSMLEFSLICVAIFSLTISLIKPIGASKAVRNISIISLSLMVACTFFYEIVHGNGVDVIHILMLFICIILIHLHVYYGSHKLANFSVYFLVISSVVGCLFAIKAKDFLSLYLAFETVSFVGYILVGIMSKKPFVSESAVKYYVIGGVCSGLMLFGISFIYGTSNSIQFSEIVNSPLATVGIILFLCGVFFKLTAFPFHFWAPDVYYAGNLPAIAVIAIIPKIAALFAFANLIPFLHSHLAFTVVMLVSVGSMFIGAFGGIFQKHIQRIIAYSGIANMGYILAIYTDPNFSYKTLVEFVIIYSISVLFLITILMSIRKNFAYDGTITSVQGLYKTNPFFTFFLSVALLNLAGIPPLAGFVGKYIIIKDLIVSGHFILPLAIVLSSAIALFYYLKIIKNLYFGIPSKELELYKSFNVAFTIKVYTFIMLVFTVGYIFVQYTPFYQNLLQF